MPFRLPPALGAELTRLAGRSVRAFYNPYWEVWGTYTDYRLYTSFGIPAGRAFRGIGRDIVSGAASRYSARAVALLAGGSPIGRGLNRVAQDYGVQDGLGRLAGDAFDSFVGTGAVSAEAVNEAESVQQVGLFKKERQPLRFVYNRGSEAIEYTFPYGSQIRVVGSTGLVRRSVAAKYEDVHAPTIKERTKNTDLMVTITAHLDSTQYSDIKDFMDTFIHTKTSIEVYNAKLNNMFGITSIVILNFDFPHSHDYTFQPVVINCASDAVIERAQAVDEVAVADIEVPSGPTVVGEGLTLEDIS